MHGAEVYRKGCRRHVRTCKIHFLFFMGASILPESVCISQDVRVCVCACVRSGFEVDPRRGAFRMAGESLPAMALLRSTVETCAHTGAGSTRADTYCTHTWTHAQLEAVSDKGATVFYETGEWAAKHHTCQLLSGRRHPEKEKKTKKTDLTRLTMVGSVKNARHAYLHLSRLPFSQITKYNSHQP